MKITHKLIVDVSIPENDETLKLDAEGFESITKQNLKIQEKLKQLFTNGKVIAVHTNDTTTMQVSDTLGITVHTKTVSTQNNCFKFDKPMEVQFLDDVMHYEGSVLKERFLALLK